jgi:hypothetical protein
MPGLATACVGLGLVIANAILSPRATSAAEAREVADEYNRTLFKELSRAEAMPSQPSAAAGVAGTIVSLGVSL